MKKVLVVHYGELFLKGGNRSFFIQKLVNNISLTLQKNHFSHFQISTEFNQLLIIPPASLPIEQVDQELVSLLTILKSVFGISVFFRAFQLESSLPQLVHFVNNLTDYYQFNFNSFKFDISRGDKNFPSNSLTLQKELGEILVKKHNLQVNLDHPEKTFYVRIYQPFILFYQERLTGLGGLPVGSSGKVLVLLSGGIDSPVAAYQLMKRGLSVSYLHFYSQKNGQEKIFALGEKLQPYNNYSNNIYLADIQPFMNEIRHISQSKYRLIILKRMFVRLACRLAQELKITAIATGDSLAQVASQTLESLTVVQQASSLLFLQPLISWDKNEIIQEAKKIETYELSIQTYLDCCSLFEPLHPVTKPDQATVEELEKEILWSEVLEKILSRVEKRSY
ncbi:MAG: tRNA 4-thiouridine(8) synthase ThiI [Candidatus Moeniiplasma glomeromycotorum]|nr:tRNA 4-thiouridine(8) synthase ThiI [Candidatus Moeniiplasma glomeromycotorum]MCE8162332.1 tRNA 4-thiouridine(8) synthase ThiI [Candidatus Moeniiplasma glomeromycotorum]MCE8166256.1 tRNA 4-thiouridine(8) synthase ThiI [Candidatus Moeniiplasma glomeromycotorum]MCE8166738.1 tRNA 4-thiouridine(8) synthase ThiI [Candidatus Moeniiplasma glomeromycotorum]